MAKLTVVGGDGGDDKPVKPKQPVERTAITDPEHLQLNSQFLDLEPHILDLDRMVRITQMLLFDDIERNPGRGEMLSLLTMEKLVEMSAALIKLYDGPESEQEDDPAA